MATFLIGLVVLFVGAAIYGKFCEKVFGPDDRETPAYSKQDGVDYVPMRGWKNSLINLLNIAGTGPIIGPIQGILFGPIAFITIPIGNVIGGVTNFLAYRFDMTQALSTWLVGHFSLVLRGNFELVYLVLPLIVLAWIFAKHFNIVGMGRDFSKNLGVNYTLVLFSGLTIAAMITAAIVSVVGSISYIGLIVPNLIAIFKGDDLRSTLADTALFGALFVLCCDVIGRLVIAPYELPIELIIGTIGSLLFIALIFYRLRFGRMSLDKKQLLRLFGLDRRTPACGGAK